LCMALASQKFTEYFYLVTGMVNNIYSEFLILTPEFS
jgi:hypothetical protein